MDSNQRIPVEKVTKPIQLLAAWLTGLIVVDTAFLTAANALSEPAWAKGLLIIAAVINVPLFLISIFLLQTKFRPEMQEDSFYSKYLESKTGMLRQPVSNNQLSKLKEELYSANSETLKLVSSIQQEIKGLSFEVKDGKAQALMLPNNETIERQIEEAKEASSWNQCEIRLNRLMKTKDEFKKCLIENNIPIHGMFGNSDLDFNDPPEVVIGLGFSIEHLRTFLNAISGQAVSIVAFAYPEDEEEDVENYHKEILIGAYNSHKFGLSLEDAIDLINKPDMDIDVFYSALMH
jgi:hypothetical protein